MPAGELCVRGCERSGGPAVCGRPTRQDGSVCTLREAGRGNRFAFSKQNRCVTEVIPSPPSAPGPCPGSVLVQSPPLVLEDPAL